MKTSDILIIILIIILVIFIVFRIMNLTCCSSCLNEGFYDKKCHAITPQASDAWCNTNCNHNPPNCPPTFCKCEGNNTPSPHPSPPSPSPPSPSTPSPSPHPHPTTPSPSPSPHPHPTTPSPSPSPHPSTSTPSSEPLIGYWLYPFANQCMISGNPLKMTCPNSSVTGEGYDLQTEVLPAFATLLNNANKINTGFYLGTGAPDKILTGNCTPYGVNANTSKNYCQGAQGIGCKDYINVNNVINYGGWGWCEQDGGCNLPNSYCIKNSKGIQRPVYPNTNIVMNPGPNVVWTTDLIQNQGTSDKISPNFGYVSFDIEGVENDAGMKFGQALTKVFNNYQKSNLKTILTIPGFGIHQDNGGNNWLQYVDINAIDYLCPMYYAKINDTQKSGAGSPEVLATSVYNWINNIPQLNTRAKLKSTIPSNKIILGVSFGKNLTCGDTKNPTPCKEPIDYANALKNKGIQTLGGLSQWAIWGGGGGTSGGGGGKSCLKKTQIECKLPCKWGKWSNDGSCGCYDGTAPGLITC